MPRQAYICNTHGEFILYLSFNDEIPKFSLCPHMEEHDHEQCHESPCKYACLQSCAHVIGAVADVYVKRDWCLSPLTKVKTIDGWKQISTLTFNRTQTSVQSLTESGELIWAKIIGWHRNKLGTRQLITITPTHATPRNGFLRVTAEHLILTPNGWIEAGKLATGDIIFTGEQAPDSKMLEVINGTLLGDAHIEKGVGRFIFSQVDFEYARLKELSLASLRPYHRTRKAKDWNYASRPAYVVACPISYWSKQQRKRWYPNGKKRAPHNLELTDLMLAVWYMDDGSFLRARKTTHNPTSRIHAIGYNKTDRNFLSKLLTDYGIDNNLDKYGNLRISTKGTHVLMQRIGRFVPPSMRYKITKDAPSFDIREWLFGKATLSLDSIEVTYAPTHMIGENRIMHCLEIKDTHNYITRCGVVHNSEKANMIRCNPANQMQSQLKSVKDAKEAKEKYGDEREAFR